jgi:long-chain acyl-CoA synthetase
MQPLSSILHVDSDRAGRVAVTCSGREWTYQALDELVQRLSAGLRRSGFGPRTLLAALLPNRVEQLALHLAAFRVGVPLVRLNAGYAAPQLEYCLQQTQPLGLVADSRLGEIVAATKLPASLRQIWSVGGPFEFGADLEELLTGSPEREVIEHSPDLMATITYTSGTMARPKGVVHSRAAIGWAVAKSAALLGHRPEDVTLVRLPLHYQVGLLVQALPTLVAGGRVELLRGDSAEVYIEGLRRPPAKTMIFDSPTMLMQLFRHHELGTLDFSRLRWILSGGDFVPLRLRVMARELLGRDVAAAYGLTEAGLITCQTTPRTPQAAETVGPPVPETEIAIAGEMSGAPDALAPGQIMVRSKSQMSHYWDAPELTQSVIDRDGWIATGDVGRRTATGELLLQGRLKHIICRGSKKVSPLEVEAALLMHPAICEAGVTGVSGGEAGERIEAFVILRENFEPVPSESDLRELARERLAAYMVPDRVHFVRRLPMHPTGKLDRGRLWMMGEVSEFDESLL